ncbi:MAG: hypothetical protein ABI785_13150 [Gemmatimonadales bacterium]
MRLSGHKNSIVAPRIARLASPVEILRKEQATLSESRGDRARPAVVTTIRPTNQVDSLESNGSTPRVRACRPTNPITPTRLAPIILTAACPVTRSRASRPAKRMLATRVASIPLAAARPNSLMSVGSGLHNGE